MPSLLPSNNLGKPGRKGLNPARGCDDGGGGPGVPCHNTVFDDGFAPNYYTASTQFGAFEVPMNGQSSCITLFTCGGRLDLPEDQQICTSSGGNNIFRQVGVGFYPNWFGVVDRIDFVFCAGSATTVWWRLDHPAGSFFPISKNDQLTIPAFNSPLVACEPEIDVTPAVLTPGFS